jgi:hypothetical protein
VNLKAFNKVWDEDTRMPWGKHKGERLGDIPDKYFRWLSEQDWIDKWEGLSNYIDDLDLIEEDD